ncbi:hypothetical protein CO154_00695 [Candidatus Pacearchaeota archaeon CG_4_9_14_3_um_filter_31_7]|nr:MAG: hypothetical protein AUJ10_02385 [Candidatus Pacearchaeota archaeon CG1_02_31_27]PIN92501.1 MAG: hypothetical protein COU55_01720 [Candidatus Pacearchaeota archaeon CG10_big_fil_rev_8_21_14_0_10_31_59]PIZ80816.1 MAG: hypothetical protein COX99_01540 [Candidatus Pacearchaeota archaeon CG_4_10_14_0_2_um_filter_31_10]PJA70855.1 MAG: hypothetical protein CO154_00695 [Candidatus Pacearchaeota archaeon CG_4_9_14_3_um_filter_31_7]
MAKILIFGKGFIGKRIQEELHCEISDKHITCLKDIESEIDKFKPEIIINCIGTTGKIGGNVDDLEEIKDKALFSNSLIPIMMAEVSLRRNIKLIHLSSGCIFHYDYKNQSPITEEQEGDFFDLFYSRTKIYSEQALKILSKKYDILILRIRIPLDNRPNPKNILDKLLAYKKIINIPNSITYIPSFTEALKHLIKIDATGIYNVVNKDSLKYSKLLDIYKKYKPEFEYQIIGLDELYTKIKGKRTNILLSVEKLEKTGFKMPSIYDILEECVRTYLKNA